ncbi:MAG: hypothetical protein HQL13_06855, partial [Candidatus Omnitrophica bacterium]|nr:hypothetical protein [Candidatus Omnitrophota bacterium]
DSDHKQRLIQIIKYHYYLQYLRFLEIDLAIKYLESSWGLMLNDPGNAVGSNQINWKELEYYQVLKNRLKDKTKEPDIIEIRKHYEIDAPEEYWQELRNKVERSYATALKWAADIRNNYDPEFLQYFGVTEPGQLEFICYRVAWHVGSQDAEDLVPLVIIGRKFIEIRGFVAEKVLEGEFIIYGNQLYPFNVVAPDKFSNKLKSLEKIRDLCRGKRGWRSTWLDFEIHKIINGAPPAKITPPMSFQSKSSWQRSHRDKTGGVDFRSKKLPLEAHGDIIKFHLDKNQIKALLESPGFKPVIVHWDPSIDVPTFLGENS